MGVERRERQRDVYAFVLVTAFAAVMYAVPGEWIPWMAPLRLALVTSALSAALMVGRRLGRMEPVYLDGIRGKALLCFAGLVALSILWSVNPEVTRFSAIELLKLVAIYLTVVNVVTTSRRLAILCGALVLSSIVTSIGVIQWWQAGVNMVEGFRSRWVGVYADPNHMAMDIGIVVPLGVAFLARKQTPWVMRIACAVAAGLAVTAMVLSYSRGGFIGLCCAMGVWAFREKRRLQAIFVGVAFAACLAVFAPQTFWDRNQTVGTFHEDASAMGRVYAWNVASRISVDRPLLGVGAGSFRYAWPLYAPPEARRAYVAHNVFLDVIGELGFVGLFFFLIFVGGASGGAFEASKRNSDVAWLARAISASVTGYLICDLFSGYILSAHFYVLFGLAASAERIARQEASLPVPSPARPVEQVPMAMRALSKGA